MNPTNTDPDLPASGKHHPTVLLTIRETADRLAVSQMSVRRLLERGELTRVTMGRSVRVLSRSLDELAERGGASRGK